MITSPIGLPARAMQGPSRTDQGKPACRSAAAHPGVLTRWLLAACGCVALGCGAPYEWKVGDKRYHAAEGERVTDFVEVSIRDTREFAPGSGSLLVEPCPAAAEVGALQPNLPCWPEGEPTREVLAAVDRLPPYRGTWHLAQAAQYLNRDIGAFRQAWIIGTNPLAVAFLDGPPQVPPWPKPPAHWPERMQRPPSTQPTTTPGVVEILSPRTGEVLTIKDRRQRFAKLVTKADLDQRADVVMLFPREMQLPHGYIPPEAATQPVPSRLRVFHVREAKPLKALMHMLTEPASLEREAARVVEHPVRGVQDYRYDTSPVDRHAP